MDLLRSGRRRRRFLEILRFAPSAAYPDPSERLEQAERSEWIFAAFRRLPAQARQLLLMRDEEMAGVLGLPLGTVKSRLHRARDRLARLLEGML